MKRLLLIVGLVVFFSLTVSAKTKRITYNFYFLTVNGDPFCDGMFLVNYGTPQTLVDGYHFNVLCEDITQPVNGFVAPVDSKYQYAGSGNVMIVADQSAEYYGCGDSPPEGHFTGGDAICPPSDGGSDSYPTDVYLINPTTHTWTLWLSGGGAGEFVANYGTFDPLVGPQVKAAPSQLSPSKPKRKSFAR